MFNGSLVSQARNLELDLPIGVESDDAGQGAAGPTGEASPASAGLLKRALCAWLVGLRWLCRAPSLPACALAWRARASRALVTTTLSQPEASMDSA